MNGARMAGSRDEMEIDVENIVFLFLLRLSSAKETRSSQQRETRDTKRNENKNP